MKRCAWLVTTVASLALAASLVTPAGAIEEADRLWLVGERASADGLYVVARRVLERFVAANTGDARLPEAVLLLGKARLALGEAALALEDFRRAQSFTPRPGRPQEAKFWEAEALFRLKRYADARAAYDTVVRTDAASPFAPDALYGYAWTELESRRAEPAVTAFREFLATWPQHELAPSVTFYLARSLADLKRYGEVVTLLAPFATRYPRHKLGPDAQYLLGAARVQSGDPRGGAGDLRAFVQANPQHADAPAARRLITQTLARHGDRAELVETYKVLVAQDPPTPDGLSDAAMIAGRLGNARDQDTMWRRLRKEFPEHPLARRAALELASSAFKRKEWKEAVTQAEPATRSDEEGVRAEAFLLTGEAELKLRRFKNAAKAFEGVAVLPTAEAATRFRALAGLGLAHEEQQEWRAALAAYEAVAAKSPDATLRDWAKQRVAAVKPRVTNGGDRPVKKERSGS
jgi:TolA-binding protein